MSKATEWAAGFAARPSMQVARVRYEVTNDGRLNVCPMGGYADEVEADKAIALAHWILDIFGEGP